MILASFTLTGLTVFALQVEGYRLNQWMKAELKALDKLVKFPPYRHSCDMLARLVAHYQSPANTNQ